MLYELDIENLAVIKNAVIPFSDNFNVFTGETGAGKSILIGGINAVLGQRITKDIVRTGCKKAVVNARFVKLPAETIKKLDEFGISHDDDEITVTREIMADGGSVARINSKAAAVSVLREIGETLINIHGQHDNQTLLSPEKHIEILDSYGELQGEIDEYRSCFRTLQETARKIKKLALIERDKADRAEVLKRRIADIEEVSPEEGEDEQIDSEFAIARDSDRILNVLNRSFSALSGDDDTDGLPEIISSVQYELSDYNDILEPLKSITERLSNASIEISDIASEIRHIADGIDLDEERFDYLTKRHEQLTAIKRKYGPELSDVIKLYNDARSELDAIESSSDEIIHLKNEKEQLLNAVSAKARDLSEHREQIAMRFIAEVQEELRFLDMPNVRLAMENSKGKLTTNGVDNIEFLISANPGEPPKPMAKIASGGELSRIMLALKTVIADKDDIPTLIFDEIDTGVSGRAAQKIGIKLKNISRIRQVICVTHLTQLAVFGDNHLLIEKNVSDGHTYTTVKQLDFEGRKQEIARIMGGDNISDLMLENAEQLLRNHLE